MVFSDAYRPSVNFCSPEWHFFTCFTNLNVVFSGTVDPYLFQTGEQLSKSFKQMIARLSDISRMVNNCLYSLLSLLFYIYINNVCCPFFFPQFVCCLLLFRERYPPSLPTNHWFTFISTSLIYMSWNHKVVLKVALELYFVGVIE